MLGMRFTFHNEHNRHFLTDGSADWLWPAAEKAGVPLMVLVPGSLDVLDRIATRHPGLNIREKGPKVFEDLPAVSISPGCPVAIASASTSSRRSCPGSGAMISTG